MLRSFSDGRLAAPTAAPPPQPAPRPARRPARAFAAAASPATASAAAPRGAGAATSVVGAAEAELAEVIAAYNTRMAERMGWLENPFCYRPDLPIYYHVIQRDLIVGGQPRSEEDVDRLVAEAGVGAILNLQQDADMAHWGVDYVALATRAAGHRVPLLRVPAADFDPHSLRRALPAAVAALQRARASAGGRAVYVHCTAGLGRAPAVAIAALYWFGGMQLDEAYSYLTSIRPCGPSRDAIRGATFDLMEARRPGYAADAFAGKPAHAWATLSDNDRAHIARAHRARAARRRRGALGGDFGAAPLEF